MSKLECFCSLLIWYNDYSRVFSSSFINSASLVIGILNFFAFLSMFGNKLIKPHPFTEAFFQEDAIRIRSTVNMPLVCAVGLVSGEMIENVFSGGFDCLQIARALLDDPLFIQKLKIGEENISDCNHSNFCLAVMYSGKMACNKYEPERSRPWLKDVED